jgi:O-antigen ligase
LGPSVPVLPPFCGFGTFLFFFKPAVLVAIIGVAQLDTEPPSTTAFVAGNKSELCGESETQEAFHNGYAARRSRSGLVGFVFALAILSWRQTR